MINNLFYLTFLFLPSYLFRFPIGTAGSINFLDILLLTSVVLGSIKLFLPFSRKESKIFLNKNRFFLVCILVIILSFVLSFLLNMESSSWPSNLGKLKSFLVLPIFFGAVTATLIKKKILSFKKIQWMLFISISFQAILGYVFTITNRLTFDGRLALVYESPNFFAPLLVVAILLGVHLLRETPKQNKFLDQYPSLFRTTLILLLTANVFSLIKTESLGAWTGLIVALFVYFLSRRNYRITKRVSLLVLFATLLFLFFILNLDTFLNITQYSPSIPATSFDSRIAIYLASKKMLVDHILFGIGIGNFQMSYLEYQHFFPPFPQWAVPHAHNTFLHIWIEGGIASIVAFFVLKIRIFTSTQTKIASPSVAISLAIMIYFLIHGTVDVPFWKNDLAVIFWFFLSYLALRTTYESRA